MQDSPDGFDMPMLGLSQEEWLRHFRNTVEKQGEFISLNEEHCAALIEDRPVLLVSFETLEGIQNRADTGHPIGWELVRDLGWSHLCVLSKGDTWFRDTSVYQLFDQLKAGGFFERFEEIVFYGAGACGYAAAAFSGATKDAQVVAIQPQATLAPRLAGWDQRFPKARRLAFDGAYGFAPEMVKTADRCFVIYDPAETLDAMHATLFLGDNSILLPTPHLGSDIESDLLEMQILYRVLVRAGAGTLSRSAFYKLYRARRRHLPYLDRLLTAVSQKQRPFVSALLCASVAHRLRAPRFLRHLNGLLRAAELGHLTG